MARSPSRQVPLPIGLETKDNAVPQRRQHLADLIGALLARHWLKMQTTKARSPSNNHEEEPVEETNSD
jgi:hypothetical protein